MTNAQILALAVFAAVVMVLALLMQPASRRLDGRQKYRQRRRQGDDADPEANRHRSISPVAIALAFLTGGAMAGRDEAGDSHDIDSGTDGGDGGGGDGGGGK